MKREAEEQIQKTHIKKSNIEQVQRKHPNETDEQRALRKQIQFYFSDSNYPRDEFLLETAAENGGWIPADVLLKFNKLKQMGADKNTVLEACRESSYLEVNDNEMIKRVAPLPENDNFDERSVFVSGIPVNNKNPDKFFFSIFKEAGMTVKSVWKNRRKNGTFFLEFETLEQAQKVASAGSFTYKDKFTGFDCTLITQSKAEYLETAPEEPEEEKKPEKKKNNEKKEETMPEVELGCCVKVKGLPSDVQYNDIKKNFQALTLKLVYVDTEYAEDLVVFRFGSAEHASLAMEKLKDGTFEIEGAQYQDVELMAEDEEQTYRENVWKASQANSKQGRGRGRGRGRGGKRGRGKGRR